MLYKLLKHKVSKNQLLGFTIANLIGLSIVFMGIQTYTDIRQVFTSKDSFLQDEYIVLTKKISTISSLVGSSPTFTKQEIEHLKKQPFIHNVGVFTASHFNIRTNISLVGQQYGLSTDMFFEAVPDQFIDVESNDWKFTPSDETVPIIIPRSYLDVYNFGFATSKQLPKVSEGLINSIGLSIQLSGKGQSKTYKGKIVGFSKRLNTLLVPEHFLIHANSLFSEKQDVDPLRIIIEVKNSSDPQLAQFIKNQGYLIDGNQLDTGKARYFLNISISIVLFIGLLISALACYILILSIYLIVEKNIYSLENLALLGYSSKKIARPYLIITSLLVTLTTVLALGLARIGQSIYLPLVRAVTQESLTVGLSTFTWLLSLLILVVILIMSYFIITHKIKQIACFKK